MAWRKWIVRGVVFGIVGTAAMGVWIYQRWTCPEEIRRQVIAKLGEHFVGAHIGVEAARLQLFGGISVTDLRLRRRDDLDKSDFAVIRSGVIYHDKEQLLNGRLIIRKLELHRPRIRVVRTADGRWNLGGLLAPPDLSVHLPTLVIQHGTLIFEDRRAGPAAAPLEVRDVNLCLLNDDPILKVSFEGSGCTDAAGPVRISGSWRRDTGDVVLKLEAGSVPIPGLINCVAAYWPEQAAHFRQLDGQGEIRLDILYRPAATQPWTHDLQAKIKNGSFHHAAAPWPLDKLQASLRCVNGCVLRAELAATAGGASIKAEIKDFTPRPDTPLTDCFRELLVHVDHLPVTSDLFAALPQGLEKIRKIESEYRPTGYANVVFQLTRETDGNWRRFCRVLPQGMDACFHGFAYPLTQVTGKVDYEATSVEDTIVRVDLVGRARADQPVYVKGEVTGQSPNIGIALDIWGDNLPIDAKLIDALPPKIKQLTQDFGPSGLVNVKAFIRKSALAARPANTFHVEVHDARVRFKAFPYPLEQVAGHVDVDADGWRFGPFRGTHKGGVIAAAGRSLPGDQDRAQIKLRGSDITLDAELKAALLQPELTRTWDTFAPTGQIDFEGNVALLAGKPDIDIDVTLRGCSIEPTFFHYRLDDLNGKVHYAAQQVELRNLRASHGVTDLSLEEGRVCLKASGGIWAELKNIQGNPVVPDEAFVTALPSLVGRCCASLGVRQPLSLRTDLVIDTTDDPAHPPTIYWDGGVGVRDATFGTGIQLDHVSGVVYSRGNYKDSRLETVVGNLHLTDATLFRQPFRDIRSQFKVTEKEPNVLLLPSVSANLFGGAVYGQVRVEFGRDIDYTIDLTGSQIELEQFGRHNHIGHNSELTGPLFARLYLTGKGSDPNTLAGSGSLEMPKGKLYNLPPLIDLLKVLSLRLPDRTFFEEAHAKFDITGPRAHFRELNLFGNWVSLRGRGDMNLDGSDLNLDFHVDWARLNQALPPVIDKIPPLVSDQLLMIKMRGAYGNVRCTAEIVPGVTQPLKKMFTGGSEPASRSGKP